MKMLQKYSHTIYYFHLFSSRGIASAWLFYSAKLRTIALLGLFVIDLVAVGPVSIPDLTLW